MQGIVTEYKGPTDSTGSRVIAKCAAKRITVPWDHALNVTGNHAAAARELAIKLGWKGAWVGGSMPSGAYCWVPSDRGADTFEVQS